MTINDITYKIRGAAYNVYNELGPGLLESVYEEVLCYELIHNELNVQRQVEVPIIYRNTELKTRLRLDILVENKVIVELKSVEELNKLHYKQLLTYLKLANKEIGILINFNTTDINKEIHRIANNYIEDNRKQTE